MKKTLFLLFILAAAALAGCAAYSPSPSDNPPGGNTVTFTPETEQPVSDSGEKLIDVTLTGGSGRASIESPAVLFMQPDGSDFARIVWNSPNYTYMKIAEETYLPVNIEGNSVFELPVTLDTDMEVIACTAAMSAPKEIEYVLRFDSATLR